ncbi:hypothetical protein U1Q18_050856 [Sarracenia purpurea var. burkii]
MSNSFQEITNNPPVRNPCDSLKFDDPIYCSTTTNPTAKSTVPSGGPCDKLDFNDPYFCNKGSMNPQDIQMMLLSSDRRMDRKTIIPGFLQIGHHRRGNIRIIRRKAQRQTVQIMITTTGTRGPLLLLNRIRRTTGELNAFNGPYFDKNSKC